MSYVGGGWREGRATDVVGGASTATLSSISPTTDTKGKVISLTANGSGFVNGAQIYAGYNPEPTVFVSSSQLRCDAFPTSPEVRPYNMVTLDQASAEMSKGTWDSVNQSTNTTVIRTNAGAAYGTWSIEAASTTGGNNTPAVSPIGGGTWARFPVLPSTTYTMWASYWHDAQWSSAFRLRIYQYKGDDTYIAADRVQLFTGIPRQTWTPFAWTFTTDANAGFVLPVLEGAPAGTAGSPTIGQPVRFDCFGLAQGRWATGWVPPSVALTPPSQNLLSTEQATLETNTGITGTQSGWTTFSSVTQTTTRVTTPPAMEGTTSIECVNVSAATNWIGC